MIHYYGLEWQRALKLMITNTLMALDDFPQEISHRYRTASLIRQNYKKHQTARTSLGHSDRNLKSILAILPRNPGNCSNIPSEHQLEKQTLYGVVSIIYPMHQNIYLNSSFGKRSCLNRDHFELYD